MPPARDHRMYVVDTDATSHGCLSNIATLTDARPICSNAT
jgi:hypothetical protein